MIETEDATNRIFEEFGLDGTGHIINGHVPVHQSEGENPLKCDGKVIMIDGGFSKPYHKVTGIAGYTLTYNSYGLTLTAHEPFESAEQVIQTEKILCPTKSLCSTHLTEYLSAIPTTVRN